MKRKKKKKEIEKSLFRKFEKHRQPGRAGWSTAILLSAAVFFYVNKRPESGQLMAGFLRATVCCLSFFLFFLSLRSVIPLPPLFYFLFFLGSLNFFGS